MDHWAEGPVEERTLLDREQLGISCTKHGFAGARK
jgi:hypothetical protein